MKLKKVHLSVTSDEVAYFLCIYAHIYTFNIKKKIKSSQVLLELGKVISLSKII